MTNQEARQASQDKLQSISSLCKALKMVPNAKQILTPEGVLENQVIFTDMEQYDIDEEQPLQDVGSTPGVGSTPEKKKKKSKSKKKNA